MTGGILGIGVNSLLAYKSAIATTSENIANATTEYYSRRQINFAESLFNSGVNISNVSRVFDSVANNDFLGKTSTASQLSTYYDSVSDFEKLLDNDNTNITKYLQDTYKAAQSLTALTGSAQSRTAFLNQLGNLSDRIKSMSNEINLKKSILNDGIRSSVAQTNQLLTQIGQINRQISLQSEDARDSLLDQRNKLLHNLSEFMNFTIHDESNDSINISLENGINVVSGQDVRLLSTMEDSENATLLHIGIENGYSGTIDISSFMTGGSLGGMVNLRQGSYDSADRGLGRLALVIADMFNAQNKLGADLNGDLGGNIFRDINDSTLTSARVSANSTNTGSGTFEVNIDDVSDLKLADYRITFTSATAFTVTRTDTGDSVSSGTISSYPTDVSFDGMTVSITAGTFSAGDKFLVRPFQGAGDSTRITLSDSSKLALAFPVQATKSTSNLGDGTITVDDITDTTTTAFTTASKQLSPPIRIEFLTATSYQLVDTSDDSVIEGPLTYDPSTGEDIFPTAGSYDPGYRVSLHGTMKAGDEFTIDYNANTIGDNANARGFTDLYTEKVVEGTMTMNQAYMAISSDISLKTNTANSQLASATILKNQAEQRFYSVSGVDSTAELTNLMNYQQSYQASAQIIQSARYIFETLLGMLR